MPSAKSNLKRQLKVLVGKIVKDRKFEFEEAEYGQAYDLLVSGKVTNIVNNVLSIVNYKSIAEALFPVLGKLYSFSWSLDVEKLSIFIEQTKKHFDTSNYIGGRHEFERAFLKYLLVIFSTKYNGDIFKLIKKFSRGDNELYDFTESLREILPDLNLTNEDLISLLLWLTNKIKVEQPDVIDLNLPAIGQAIRVLCFQKPLQGKELYKHCILSNPPILQRFHSSIISGLLDYDLNFLEELKNIIQKPEIQPIVICSLGAGRFTNETPFQNIIDLAESVKEPTDSYFLELPKLYASIISFKEITDSTLIDYCFNCLLKLSIRGNNGITSVILRELRFITGYDQEVSDILSVIIASDQFDIAYGKAIINSFYNYTNYKAFFGILVELALKMKPNLPINDLSEDILILRRKNQSSFDKGLIHLLIHDEGYIRMIATRIFSQLNLGYYIRGFGIDVLSLSALEQYKLVITLTEDYHEPKKIIPYLIAFLKSHFDLVRELTLHKIEMFCENFGQPTVDALKSNIEPNNSTHILYLQRVETFLKNFDKMLDKKRGIKELNPAYTQNKYLQQYYKSRDKNMRKQMNKEPDKHNFLSMITTVHLMKGGGWKADSKNEVSQLATIETSMQLPREYVLAPERFDWNRQIAYSENWQNKFDEWEAIISS